MIEYQTVFEAAPWGWRAAATIAIHSALILAAVGVGYALIRRKFPGMSRSVRNFCLILTLFWLAVFARNFCRSIFFLTDMQSAIDSDTLSTSEGIVEIVKQHPRSDTVRVEGQEFSVSREVLHSGYRDNVAHGGVLTEGARVRIRHFNGSIARVEVAVSPRLRIEAPK